ncbi:MAG: hypothetical protein HYV96_11715 [Opitutae bacterium]|nr:hypothetical protein [Opitutae bacterium]
MRRIVKWVAVALAIVVGVVAAFFGALVVGAILVIAALFALFGRGSFRVNLSGAARTKRPPTPGAAPSHAGGDVIDIEARKVETPHELK